MSTYVLDGRKLEEKFTGPQWFTYIFSHVHNLNKIQVFDFAKIYIDMQIKSISFSLCLLFCISSPKKTTAEIFSYPSFEK